MCALCVMCGLVRPVHSIYLTKSAAPYKRFQARQNPPARSELGLQARDASGDALNQCRNERKAGTAFRPSCLSPAAATLS